MNPENQSPEAPTSPTVTDVPTVPRHRLRRANNSAWEKKLPGVGQGEYAEFTCKLVEEGVPKASVTCCSAKYVATSKGQPKLPTRTHQSRRDDASRAILARGRAAARGLLLLLQLGGRHGARQRDEREPRRRGRLRQCGLAPRHLLAAWLPHASRVDLCGDVARCSLAGSHDVALRACVYASCSVEIEKHTSCNKTRAPFRRPRTSAAPRRTLPGSTRSALPTRPRSRAPRPPSAQSSDGRRWP
jgi:hypothetical protein